MDKSLDLIYQIILRYRRISLEIAYAFEELTEKLDKWVTLANV